MFPRSKKTTFFTLRFQAQKYTNGLYTGSCEPLLFHPGHQDDRLNMAQTVHFDVLSVFFIFLVQGNTSTPFFTFCSLKEIRPIFQVECSIWIIEYSYAAEHIHLLLQIIPVNGSKSIKTSRIA